MGGIRMETESSKGLASHIVEHMSALRCALVTALLVTAHSKLEVVPQDGIASRLGSGTRPIILGILPSSGPVLKALKDASSRVKGVDFIHIIDEKSTRIKRVFPPLPRFKDPVSELLFEGDTESAAEIAKWVTVAAVPQIGVHDKHTAPLYNQLSTPAITVYLRTPLDASEDSATVQYYLNRFARAVKYISDNFYYVLSSNEHAAFALDDEAPMTLAVIDGGVSYSTNTKRTSDKLTKGEIVELAEKFSAGQLEQHLKSEEVPASQGDVKVLVAKNFNVETRGKPSLVMFYAPWCGHCKALMPVWDTLGARAADEAPDLVVGKFDATNNDLPRGIEVKSYPTIYFFNSEGQAEEYNGGRAEGDFVSWLKKQDDAWGVSVK